MTSDTAQQFSTSLLPILPSSYVQMRSIVTTIFGSSDKRPFSSFHASKHQGTVEHQRSKQGSPLCATCHGFILPLISGSLPTFKSVPYGTLEGLKDRSASTICVVCALLVDIITRQQDPGYVQHADAPSSSDSSHILLRPSVDTGGYFFDLYFAGQELGAVRCVTKPSSQRLLDSLPYDDLYKERCISPNLIQEWVHRCRETHIETCSASLNVFGNRYSLSCKLILVDTIEERLVLDQLSLERRYIALSYIWGGVSALQTTTKNLHKLQQAGALSPQNVKLPKTLRDAIAVVSSLGERYLWVDTLCIIQDDETNKQLCISHMDVVYDHAVLTIVALSGHDANAGLPGVRPFTRPAHLFTEVGNLKLLAIPPGLRASAEASRYEQRGWTLQERIMSRRCLYFSPHEVYYQCKTAVWHERPLVRELLGPCGLYESPTLMNPINNSLPGSMPNAEKAYQSLVENYTRRCLTFTSDRLNAFRGMLNLFGDNYDSTCMRSGVPARFWDSLLWVPHRTLSRWPVAADEAPPTWSWLAWDGPVNFPILGSLPGSMMKAPLSPRIKFHSRARTSSLRITGGQINDIYGEAVPGTFLRDEGGLICGVLFDFEEKFTVVWDDLWFVYHSHVDNTKPEDYDGLPPFKFVLGNHVISLKSREINGDTLVNVLIVREIGESRLAERYGMAQVTENIWETLSEKTLMHII